MDDDDHSESSESDDSTSQDQDSDSSEESSSLGSNEAEGHNKAIQAFVYRRKKDIPNYRFRETLISLAFGRHVRSIPRGAFFNCRLLRDVSFRDGLETIGPTSFSGCSSLKTLSFPTSLAVIEECAFQECGLELAEFNEGLQSIERNAFSECRNLNTVSMPSSMKTIGATAFDHCCKLATLEFGSGVEEIGTGAFRNCVSLTIIRLPPSLETIKRRTFAGCTSLLSVEFPQYDMEYIGAFAFEDCNLLTNVAMQSSETEVADSSFDGCTRLVELFPPDPPDPAVHPLGSILGSHLLHLVTRYPRNDRIRDRYSRFPIHEICYNQPYFTIETALQNLKRFAGPDAIQRRDDAGMTPFHIVALSSRPDIILFQTLQAYCPRWVMEVPDRWGFRPIQYLCSNSSIPDLDRQRLVDYLAEATVMYRAHKLSLPNWRLPVISKTREILYAKETMTLEGSKDIDKIYEVLQRYELMEMLCLLELRLWSCKLDSQVGSDCGFQHHDRQQKRIKPDNREFARVNCGADIIIGNVLPYLKGA